MWKRPGSTVRRPCRKSHIFERLQNLGVGSKPPARLGKGGFSHGGVINRGLDMCSLRSAANQSHFIHYFYFVSSSTMLQIYSSICHRAKFFICNFLTCRCSRERKRHRACRHIERTSHRRHGEPGCGAKSFAFSLCIRKFTSSSASAICAGSMSTGIRSPACRS